MLQKSGRRIDRRRPVAFNLKKTRPTRGVLYGLPAINSPILTMIPGPVRVGPMSSGPDPLLDMIDRRKLAGERRLWVGAIDSRFTDQPPREYSIAGLSGIDDMKKTPLFKYGIIVFGAWLFWDSLKKL